MHYTTSDAAHTDSNSTLLTLFLSPTLTFVWVDADLGLCFSANSRLTPVSPSRVKCSGTQTTRMAKLLPSYIIDGPATRSEVAASPLFASIDLPKPSNSFAFSKPNFTCPSFFLVKVQHGCPRARFQLSVVMLPVAIQLGCGLTFANHYKLFLTGANLITLPCVSYIAVLCKWAARRQTLGQPQTHILLHFSECPCGRFLM